MPAETAELAFITATPYAELAFTTQPERASIAFTAGSLNASIAFVTAVPPASLAFTTRGLYSELAFVTAYDRISLAFTTKADNEVVTDLIYVLATDCSQVLVKIPNAPLLVADDVTIRKYNSDYYFAVTVEIDEDLTTALVTFVPKGDSVYEIMVNSADEELDIIQRMLIDCCTGKAFNRENADYTQSISEFDDNYQNWLTFKTFYRGIYASFMVGDYDNTNLLLARIEELFNCSSICKC